MITDDMLSGLVTHFNGTVEIQPREKVIPAETERREEIKSSRRHGRPPARQSEKVTRAKEKMMQEFGIPEPLAHRLIQRFAMECRIAFEHAADMCWLGLVALEHLRDMEANADDK
jgi:hypothetical protein